MQVVTREDHPARQSPRTRVRQAWADPERP